MAVQIVLGLEHEIKDILLDWLREFDIDHGSVSEVDLVLEHLLLSIHALDHKGDCTEDISDLEGAYDRHHVCEEHHQLPLWINITTTEHHDSRVLCDKIFSEHWLVIETALVGEVLLVG